MTIVNTNVGSLIAKSSLAAQNKNMEASIEKLSTGLRINTHLMMLLAWLFQAEWKALYVDFLKLSEIVVTVKICLILLKALVLRL
jgi:hypothetical protein